MRNRAILVSLIGSSFGLLLGCSTSPTTDEEFGQSVRQMVRSQKVHVAVDEAPVEGGDGQRLESVLDGYRDAAPAARESAPSSSIVINTGQ